MWLKKEEKDFIRLVWVLWKRINAMGDSFTEDNWNSSAEDPLKWLLNNISLIKEFIIIYIIKAGLQFIVF